MFYQNILFKENKREYWQNNLKITYKISIVLNYINMICKSLKLLFAFK